MNKDFGVEVTAKSNLKSMKREKVQVKNLELDTGIIQVTQTILSCDQNIGEKYK